MKRNYMAALGYQLLVIVTPLIMTPYLSRVLGATAIGRDAYVNAIVQLFLTISLLNVGVYGRKKIAEAQTKIDLMKTFSGIYFLQFIVAGSVSLVYLIISIQIEQYQSLFWLYGLTVLANILDVSWFFIGREQIERIMVRNVFVRLISVFSVLLWVKDSYDLPKYILINGLALLVGQIVTWVALLKEIGLPYFSWKDTCHHIRPMLVLSVVPLFSLVYMVLNKVVLGLFINPIEVGYYSQAFKFYTIGMGAVIATSTVLMPRMVKIYKQGGLQEFTQLTHFSFRYTFATTLPLCFGLMGVAPLLVPIFLGEEFRPVIGNVLLIAPCLILTGISEVLGGQILLITDRYRSYAFSIVIGALGSGLFNLLTVPTLGSRGTMLSFLLSQVIIVGYQWIVVRKILSSRIRFSSISIYIFLSVMIFLGLRLIPILFNDLLDWQCLCAQFIFAPVIYIGGIWVLKDSLFYQIKRKVGKKHVKL